MSKSQEKGLPFHNVNAEVMHNAAALAYPDLSQSLNAVPYAMLCNLLFHSL